MLERIRVLLFLGLFLAASHTSASSTGEKLLHDLLGESDESALDESVLMEDVETQWDSHREGRIADEAHEDAEYAALSEQEESLESKLLEATDTEEAADDLQRADRGMLRLCRDDTECVFAGSYVLKPSQNPSHNPKHSKTTAKKNTEQAASYFAFRVKANEVDPQAKTCLFELRFFSFPAAKRERVTQAGNVQLKGKLKHTHCKRGSVQDYMQRHPVYFTTNEKGKILRLCCDPRDPKSVCAQKKFIVSQSLISVHRRTAEATSNLEFDSADSEPTFQDGKYVTRHNVRISDEELAIDDVSYGVRLLQDDQQGSSVNWRKRSRTQAGGSTVAVRSSVKAKVDRRTKQHCLKDAHSKAAISVDQRVRHDPFRGYDESINVNQGNQGKSKMNVDFRLNRVSAKSLPKKAASASMDTSSCRAVAKLARKSGLVEADLSIADKFGADDSGFGPVDYEWMQEQLQTSDDNHDLHSFFDTHVHLVPEADEQVQQWSKDGSIDAHAVTKWAIFLADLDDGGQNEALLEKYMTDSQLPLDSRQNILASLIGPKKRGPQISNALQMISSSKLDISATAHSVLGAMLDPYRQLEGTADMPKHVENAYSFLESSLTGTDRDVASQPFPELDADTVAEHALTNSKWRRADALVEEQLQKKKKKKSPYAQGPVRNIINKEYKISSSKYHLLAWKNVASTTNQLNKKSKCQEGVKLSGTTSFDLALLGKKLQIFGLQAALVVTRQSSKLSCFVLVLSKKISVPCSKSKKPKKGRKSLQRSPGRNRSRRPVDKLDMSKDSKALLHYKKTFFKRKFFGRKKIILVGPIPLTIEFAVHGQSGVSLAADVDLSALPKIGLMAGFQAGANLNLKLSVAIDLLVVKASLDGRLDIVNGQLPARAASQLFPPTFSASLDLVFAVGGGAISATVRVLDVGRVLIEAGKAVLRVAGAAIKLAGKGLKAIGKALGFGGRRRRRRKLDANHYLNLCKEVRKETRKTRREGKQTKFFRDNQLGQREPWRHEGNGCCVSRAPLIWAGRAHNIQDCQRRCAAHPSCGSYSYGWYRSTHCTLQQKHTLVRIDGAKDVCDPSGKNKVKCFSNIRRQCDDCTSYDTKDSATLRAAGIGLSFTHSNKRDRRAAARCGGGKNWFGWSTGGGGQLFYAAPRSGVVTLDFGNCGAGGEVVVMIGVRTVARATPNRPSVPVRIPVRQGDVLTISDRGANAVVNLRSIDICGGGAGSYHDEGKGCCVSRSAALWAGEAGDQVRCQAKCDANPSCGSYSYGWKRSSWCVLQRKATLIDVKNKARECGISGPPSRLFTADIEQTDERELELNADPTEAVNELEEDLGTDVEPREEPKSADEDVDKDVFIEQDTGMGGRRRRRRRRQGGRRRRGKKQNLRRRRNVKGCRPLRGTKHRVFRGGRCHDGRPGASCGKSKDCLGIPVTGRKVCRHKKCQGGRPGDSCKNSVDCQSRCCDRKADRCHGRGRCPRRGAKPPSHGKVHCYSRGTNFLANELELNTDPVEAVNELEDDLVQTKSTNSRHLLSTQTTSGGRACGIYKCYTLKILTIKPFFKTTKNLFCFSCNSARKEFVKVCPAKKG